MKQLLGLLLAIMMTTQATAGDTGYYETRFAANLQVIEFTQTRARLKGLHDPAMWYIMADILDRSDPKVHCWTQQVFSNDPYEGHFCVPERLYEKASGSTEITMVYAQCATESWPLSQGLWVEKRFFYRNKWKFNKNCPDMRYHVEVQYLN